MSNMYVYCLIGDAAGRLKHGTRKADFSATDYKLALNLNVCFQTPERYFLNDTSTYHNPQRQIITMSSSTSPTTSPTPTTGFIRLSDIYCNTLSKTKQIKNMSKSVDSSRSDGSSDGKTTVYRIEDVPSFEACEILLLVGPAASGKSTMARYFTAGLPSPESM